MAYSIVPKPKPAAPRPGPARIGRRRSTALSDWKGPERRQTWQKIQARRASRLAWTWIGGVAALTTLVAVLVTVLDGPPRPTVVPRHRAEALCFALAGPPAFEPPMPVESNAAVVEGHFPANTTVAIALQSQMRFEDHMVMDQTHQAVGDFDVTALWLKLPDARGLATWLVIGWIEDGDLAVCSFRFGSVSAETEQVGDVRFWGQRLMHQVLVPENFQSGTLPDVRGHLSAGQRLPRFGPA